MGRWMAQTGDHIYQNGSSDLAGFNQFGERTPAGEMRYPFELEFVPNTDILGSTNDESVWYKQLVENSENIGEDDVLFEVYG